MKAVVAAFNQEKALVGAFSVITNLRMELFEALVCTPCLQSGLSLTAAQIADCQEVFLLLDKDEDGKLSTRQHCPYIHCCTLIST